MDTKRELKNLYKQTRRPMGIFQIKNMVNGKVFIGSSPNLDGVFNKYKFQLKMGGCWIKELQKDWQLHGEGSFSFEILEYLEDKENLMPDFEALEALEEKWLRNLAPFGDKGYNKLSSKLADKL